MLIIKRALFAVTSFSLMPSTTWGGSWRTTAPFESESLLLLYVCQGRTNPGASVKFTSINGSSWGTNHTRPFAPGCSLIASVKVPKKGLWTRQHLDRFEIFTDERFRIWTLCCSFDLIWKYNSCQSKIMPFVWIANPCSSLSTSFWKLPFVSF